MDQQSETSKDAADKRVKGIHRKTRKQYSAEEKVKPHGPAFDAAQVRIVDQKLG